MGSTTSTKTAESAEEMLQRFLAVADDRQAMEPLDQLVRHHADPVIKAVLRRKMEVDLDRNASGPQRGKELDAEDILSTSRSCLLEHLWAMKESAETEPLHDFRAYVGRITLNAFALHIRQQCPERHQLRRSD